jgi:hypothetical protein
MYHKMNSVMVGIVTGSLAFLASALAAVADGAQHIDLPNTLAVVVPIGCFGWYLSARLTRIEDTIRDLDCMRCPKKPSDPDIEKY